MTIIGFNFTKIDVEREKGAKGKINIKNNVKLTNVEEAKLSMGDSSKKVAKIDFEFTVVYEPKIGSMKFKGNILKMAKASKVDSLLGAWKEKNKLPRENIPQIMNTLLKKCNIQALILSQQVNLPSPIPMPKVKADTKKKEKE